MTRHFWRERKSRPPFPHHPWQLFDLPPPPLKSDFTDGQLLLTHHIVHCSIQVDMHITYYNLRSNWAIGMLPYCKKSWALSGKIGTDSTLKIQGFGALPTIDCKRWKCRNCSTSIYLGQIKPKNEHDMKERYGFPMFVCDGDICTLHY